MNAPAPNTVLQTRFVATVEGCFVDTAALFLSEDGKTVELLEWTPDIHPQGGATFKEALKLGEDCAIAGGGWHIPAPHELVSLVNYTKDCPATDAPGIDGGWYWTNQVDPSSPSGGALCVGMGGGLVYWSSQDGRGRVRACRRVRASQHLNLGL